MNQILLLTGNVGSVFENIDAGLSVWLNELIVKVKSQGPDFVALHFQETGGKHYKNGSKVIQNFFSALVEAFTIAGYSLIEGIVDSDSDVEQQFTALSNVYFIRKNCHTEVQTWDFENATFVPINPSGASGKLFTGKDVNASSRVQKVKFPQHFFPNCKWSRKGFARTRWRFGETAFDLVNIHLFHDSSNIVAASTFPSPFSQNRQRALNFILDKFQNDDLKNVPMFIFGDFNFRVNSFDIFEMLRKEVSELSNAPSSKDGTPKLIIDAKKFTAPNHEKRFKDEWKWLRAFDFELSNFEALGEMDIRFHPTYPFDESDAGKFMRTRVPSWCDRILFTHDSKSIISNDPEPEYNLIGSNICMGDHKPVYLTFHLKSGKGSSDLISESPVEKIHIFDAPHSEEEPGSRLDPSIDVSPNPKPRNRFVSFLRENLSFHYEPSRTRVIKSPSLAPSVTSTGTASSTRKKCCFLTSRKSDADGDSQGLTNEVKGRGKQNILLSNQIESCPLRANDKSHIESESDPETGTIPRKVAGRGKGRSKDTSRRGSSGCCPGCHIL